MLLVPIFILGCSLLDAQKIPENGDYKWVMGDMTIYVEISHGKCLSIGRYYTYRPFFRYRDVVTTGRYPHYVFNRHTGDIIINATFIKPDRFVADISFNGELIASDAVFIPFVPEEGTTF